MKTSSQVTLFFFLAFAISWSSWFLAALYAQPKQLLLLVGLFGPAISAAAVTGLADGKKGLWNLFGRYGIWRFPPRWYLFALLVTPAIFVAAALNQPVIFARAPSYSVVGTFVYLLFQTSGEEIGWRGLALPRLQSNRSALFASLGLGVVWAAWHVPLYLAQFSQSVVPFPYFALFIIADSVLFTVVFNNTGGSLLAVTIFHASTDAIPSFVPIQGFSDFSWAAVVGLTWLAAVLLVKVYGPARLSGRDIESKETSKSLGRAQQ